MKNIAKISMIVLFLFAGCGTSSYITKTWKAPGLQPKKYNKILVLGLIRESDNTLRENMEKHLMNDLKNMGYNAVCSCDEYNPKAFENMTEEKALEKLSGGGIDAVLTIVLLDKTKERYYVPGQVYYSPYYTYHNRFWGYYTTMYNRIYTPDYYAVNTKYFWETNFYDLTSANKELLYSAQSQSFDPGSSESLGHEYGQMIIKNMVKNNVLVEQKGERSETVKK